MPSIKKYRRKPDTWEAVKFVGGPQAATPIIDWVLSHGATASWSESYPAWVSEAGDESYPAAEEQIKITINGENRYIKTHYIKVRVGDVLLRDIDGHWSVLTEDEFKIRYQLAEI